MSFLCCVLGIQGLGTYTRKSWPNLTVGSSGRWKRAAIGNNAFSSPSTSPAPTPMAAVKLMRNGARWKEMETARSGVNGEEQWAVEGVSGWEQRLYVVIDLTGVSTDTSGKADEEWGKVEEGEEG
ncbi:hypothetical protein GUJ93_ZPchr0001g30394 [Zizania palustris]|uniref:Uncharacterized protein n=1 Tax=Zizania palustris TaxID=103762 RepID=A0A8J5RSP1_ZIZPA|nr:hypothetical protein GUJ93_ZPchr0001g30394 [Zizania palustris]